MKLNLSELLLVESVQERDIDFLLLEEIHCNHEFREWFIRKTFFETFKYEGIWRSISHPELGETDLLIKITSNDSTVFLLVENKIDADFQNEQANRYKKRGILHVENGDCDFFELVLVAPLNYINNQNEFEKSISYEEIKDWLHMHNDDRIKFKASLLEIAIEKLRRGYQVENNVITNKFYIDYYEFVKSNYKTLKMDKPKKNIAKDSTFITLVPQKILKMARIKHKTYIKTSDKSCVDLEIVKKGSDIEWIKKEYGKLISEEVEITETGESASLRIIVNKVEVNGDFEMQKDKIINCLDAAVKLLDIQNSYIKLKETYIQD